MDLKQPLHVSLSLLLPLLGVSCLMTDDYDAWRAGKCAQGGFEVCDYVGYEVLEWYRGPTAGDLNCELHWSLSGDPWPKDRAPCPDCLFAFEITAGYAPALSSDDGTCASLSTDSSFGYGILLDYDYEGQIGDWLMYYSTSNASWGLFTPVDFQPAKNKFTYVTGYRDQQNGNQFSTEYWTGGATLE